ncbi:hypothetical protein H2248_001796 [Termitomyces sp. 'cryptogamus']|nr:hypothetical protein H2248_001796 [Termitomyces sp. 'cryptogamus']
MLTPVGSHSSSSLPVAAPVSSHPLPVPVSSASPHSFVSSHVSLPLVSVPPTDFSDSVTPHPSFTPTLLFPHFAHTTPLVFDCSPFPSSFLWAASVRPTSVSPHLLPPPTQVPVYPPFFNPPPVFPPFYAPQLQPYAAAPLPPVCSGYPDNFYDSYCHYFFPEYVSVLFSCSAGCLYSFC